VFIDHNYYNTVALPLARGGCLFGQVQIWASSKLNKYNKFCDIFVAPKKQTGSFGN